MGMDFPYDVPVGQPLDSALPFFAKGATIDNLTNQYLYLPNVARSVAPYAQVTFLFSYGIREAKIQFLAPPGIVQQAQLPGQVVHAIFFAEVPPSGEQYARTGGIDVIDQDFQPLRLVAAAGTSGLLADARHQHLAQVVDTGGTSKWQFGAHADTNYIGGDGSAGGLMQVYSQLAPIGNIDLVILGSALTGDVHIGNLKGGTGVLFIDTNIKVDVWHSGLNRGHGLQFLDSANSVTLELPTALATGISLKASLLGQSYKITNDLDAVRFLGGGTANAVVIIGTQAGAGTDGVINFQNNAGDGGNAFQVLASGGTLANFLRAAGALSTGSPEISAQGSDANISILLTPKGTGSVRVTGQLTASGGIPESNITNLVSDLTKIFSPGGVQQSTGHIVEGTATLNNGSVTVTLTGSAAFSNGNSYQVAVTAITTTNQYRVNYLAGNQFQIISSQGAGDNSTVSFIAVGN